MSVIAGSADRLGQEEEVMAGVEVEVEVEVEVGLEGSKDDVSGMATVQAAAPSSASDTANTVDTACTANASSLSFTGLLERWHGSELCWLNGAYRMSSPSTARIIEASSTDRSLKGLERFMCSLRNNQSINQMNKDKKIEVESERTKKNVLNMM